MFHGTWAIKAGAGQCKAESSNISHKRLTLSIYSKMMLLFTESSINYGPWSRLRPKEDILIMEFNVFKRSIMHLNTFVLGRHFTTEKLRLYLLLWKMSLLKVVFLRSFTMTKFW